MKVERNSRTPRAIPFLIAVCFVGLPACAKYSGGTGEPNDPYQIATAADLIALGETPEDYDKHFLLTADIDLDPNLPGRKVFDRAVIASDADDVNEGFDGTSFTGVFDGRGHTISHLTITGKDYLGLFGELGSWDAPGRVMNLGVVDVNIAASDHCVGGLVGSNWYGDLTQCYATGRVTGGDSIGGLVGRSVSGTVTQCHSTATVSGTGAVGGLVGTTDYDSVTRSYTTGAVSGDSVVGGLMGGGYLGDVSDCYSTATVSGAADYVGGLVGYNCDGAVTRCFSSGAVRGTNYVGGLVGQNDTDQASPVVTQCYSTSAVTGDSYIGGLVGNNSVGSVIGSYSVGTVSGTGQHVGGLVGSGDYSASNSVWDIENSGLSESCAGVGLTTAEMMDPYMLGLNGFANDPNWVLDTGRDYPRLAWEGTPGQIIPEPDIDWLAGQGTADSPYRIDRADQVVLLGRASVLCDKHFVLGADINLDPNLPDGHIFGPAVIPTFRGVFDGNRHIISNLVIEGGSYLGLFGQLGEGAEVKNLGVVDVNVIGSGESVGALAGRNNGSIATSYSTGSVSGTSSVGGLVGYNGYYGDVTACYSTATVSGTEDHVGGLVGYAYYSTVTQCYSTGSVTGDENVGGLVGYNLGSVTQCYSTSAVSATDCVGGLVGCNKYGGTMTQCYSTGAVIGTGELSSVGGLVGSGDFYRVYNSVWDIENSGLSGSSGGVGLTTAEMMAPHVLGLNGFADDPNWVLNAGLDYPRLAWEGTPGVTIPEPDIDWLAGQGTPERPYMIDTADRLILMGKASILWDKYFVLGADINLDPNLPGGHIFGQAVIPTFRGVFDGNRHLISNLVIEGVSYLGLFGRLESGAEVKNVGVVDVVVTGAGEHVGGLVGWNRRGAATQCYATGEVSGTWYVGGLVGDNWGGAVTQCYAAGMVSGDGAVGGLVGGNFGSITASYSTGAVVGASNSVGGLIGWNNEDVMQCYSTGLVIGNTGVLGSMSVGGLVGENGDYVTGSFWDIQTSGQPQMPWSAGTGKTTAEMQTARMFLDAGWDFVGETGNGTEDIWWIDEGKDYPHLSWEATTK